MYDITTAASIKPGTSYSRSRNVLTVSDVALRPWTTEQTVICFCYEALCYVHCFVFVYCKYVHIFNNKLSSRSELAIIKDKQTRFFQTMLRARSTMTDDPFMYCLNLTLHQGRTRGVSGFCNPPC